MKRFRLSRSPDSIAADHRNSHQHAERLAKSILKGIEDIGHFFLPLDHNPSISKETIGLLIGEFKRQKYVVIQHKELGCIEFSLPAGLNVNNGKGISHG